MIIVRLIGGLGNQMFQYAIGRNLAFKNNAELKFDICDLQKKPLVGTPRKYNLHCFNIAENFATKEEIKEIKNKANGFFLRLKKLFLNKPIQYTNSSVISEKENFVFDEEILKLGRDAYLNGYWQNEKYFCGIREILLEEFSVKTLPDKKNQKILNFINSLNSASIHVRRGDYVKDKRTNKHHGTCSLDYYKKAVKIIGNKVKNPHFFAFSDDPAWVKKNLKIKYPIYYVDNNDDAHSYEDLRLMQNCKHNIIANSSFSWWGAWLNKNPNKIVIAPKKWLSETSINTEDVTPKEWIKI